MDGAGSSAVGRRGNGRENRAKAWGERDDGGGRGRPTLFFSSSALLLLLLNHLLGGSADDDFFPTVFLRFWATADQSRRWRLARSRLAGRLTAWSAALDYWVSSVFPFRVRRSSNSCSPLVCTSRATCGAEQALSGSCQMWISHLIWATAATATGSSNPRGGPASRSATLMRDSMGPVYRLPFRFKTS
jgi:hypothetical protein